MFSLTFARGPAPLRSPNFTIGTDVFGQDTRFLRPSTTGAVFFFESLVLTHPPPARGLERVKFQGQIIGFEILKASIDAVNQGKG